MARWIMNNHTLFEGKNVLEVGSGVGLSGLVCGLCYPKQIILTDYKPQVMDLIAKNIDLFNTAHNRYGQIKMHHSMLDWYFGTDRFYLESLPVLDSKMSEQSKLADFLSDLDLIIGSDLIYFKESIDPLVKMVSHFFTLSKKEDPKFYVCMKVRSHELTTSFLSAMTTCFTVQELDIAQICEEFDNINARMFMLTRSRS